MELTDFINSCNKKFNCCHCWKEISWWFAYYWWWITSEDALKRHEEECEENPKSKKWILKTFILKCQKSADVYNCLNCKHFQKGCEGSKK